MGEQSTNDKIEGLEAKLDAFLAKEKLFNESQKIAKIGSWNLDLLTPELEWSEQTYHLFDKNLDATISFDEFAKLVHPDDSELMHSSFNAALQSDESPYHVIVRIINESGREWYMEAFGAVTRNENGEAIRIAGTAQDVSERKWTDELKAKNAELIKAKEEAEESEMQLSLAMNAAKAGYWNWDMETNCVTWDVRMEEIFGLIPGSFDGKYETWKEIVHPEDRDEADRQTKNALENGSDYDFQYRLNIKSELGIWRTVRAQAIVISDNSGNRIRMVGFCEDFTEHKNTENELKKSKEKAEESEKSLLQAQTIAQIGSWVMDTNTKQLDWSIQMYQMLEVGINETPSFELYFSRVHPDDLEYVKEVGGRVYDNDEAAKAEYRLLLPSGSVKNIRTEGRQILDNNGNVIKLTGIIQDVTEQKTAEIELLRSKEKAEESDNLKSAFLSNMSHEIRTPLNAILGFSSLLKEDNLSEDKKEKYLDFIELGGSRLLSLISDIVDVSKIDANQLTVKHKACNINSIVNNLYEQYKVQILNKECEIVIKKGLENPKCTILTDEARLSQILSNLIENSLKFTTEGIIEFGYTHEQNTLKFFVKDSGIGISPEHHKIIFERFKQVDNDSKKSGSGTGLGLSIVQGLINLLGGKIWVESELEKGATFCFTIPYKIAESKTVEVPKMDNNLDSNKQITILIAEDEDSNYLYLETLLQEFHFELIRVVDGKRAIEAVKNNNSIDVILMDIKMPVMDGLEATEEIRKTNKQIPIISLTAYAMAEDMQKALNAGCNDYLPKPFSKASLVEILNKYLIKDAAIL